MVDNKNILTKNIKGKIHYFLNLALVPFEHIDLYVSEIEKMMKINKKKTNPHIMAVWEARGLSES